LRQPEREVLKHFIIIEEAHHLFLETRKEEDIADIIMREIRELGEAIIVIDQHPSKMSVSALGNLSTKFALTLSLNQDVSSLANAMLLGKDERRYMSMLTLGQCICRSDRFPYPILLNIENYPIQKGTVTDEDLKGLMAGYLKDIKPEYPTIAKQGSIYNIQNQETLSPLGRIILENIEMKPFIGFVKRFKDLGLKITDGYRVIEELTAMRLIVPLTIDGQRLYEVSQKGREALGRKAFHKGRGGLEHRYYIEKIKEHYLIREGFTYLEKDDIDLVIEKGDQILAIQMETGKSDIHGNLMKLCRHKADLKYSLATNRDAEVQVREILKNNFLPDRERIQVAFVKDFLQSPPIL
jgi:hypothetical protein